MIAARRFTRHIECVLPPGMGAYRPHRKTWIIPATAVAIIWDGFEGRDNTLLVALDLEDAYNRVRLPILADRLLQLGISVFWVRWVISALNTRRCMIKHRTRRSEWTSSGLSSVPSPLQHIYTLPLARLNQPHCRLRTFADDILVNCRGKSVQDMIDLISPTLRNIEAHCECSGMHCNGEKARAMLCTLNNRLQPSSYPPIAMMGKRSEFQTHFVTLVSSLTDSSTSLSMSTLSSVVSTQPISWRLQLVPVKSRHWVIVIDYNQFFE